MIVPGVQVGLLFSQSNVHFEELDPEGGGGERKKEKEHN